MGELADRITGRMDEIAGQDPLALQVTSGAKSLEDIAKMRLDELEKHNARLAQITLLSFREAVVMLANEVESLQQKLDSVIEGQNASG